MTHIYPCFEYRLRGEAENAEVYGHRAADELETEIIRVGPEKVMAFVAVPVVGSLCGPCLLWPVILAAYAKFVTDTACC